MLNRYLIRLIELPLKRILLNGSMIILAFASTKAQNTDFKTTFTDAEYYFMFQDYREALPLYLKLYDLNRLNANINYRIGLCYLNIPGVKKKSIPFLEFAVNKVNKIYQEGSYKEENAPVNAFFYLGEAYRINNQLDKAIETYKLFRSQLEIKDLYNLDYVNQQIKACELARDMINDPLNLNLEKVDLIPDAGKFCYNPVISGDGKTMAFSLKEKFYDGIYMSRFVNGKWETARNITLDLGVEGEVYSTNLNYNGTILLLFKNDKSDGNIYQSKFEKGKWGKAQKLNKNVNTLDWETFASFSPDGKTLFFTSNHKGGYGGLDIYKSTQQANGEWGSPTNLGNTINTSYNEESPVLSRDGKILYFASQGHSSMGGFDIFYSLKMDDNSWTTPVNIGYPISTTDDDLFYFPIDSSSAYISMVNEDSPGSRDIYKLQISKKQVIPEIQIKGKIYLSDNREIESNAFTIKITDSKIGKLVQSTQPKSISGDFNATLKPGNYICEVKGVGYQTQTRNIYIPDGYTQKVMPFEFNLLAEEVSKGEYVTIKSILFDFDSYSLTRDALFEIEKIYQLMDKNPSLKIEVTGHTDSKGSVAYNQKLSLKRARSVVDYLVGKGIDESRFVTKAVGAFANIAANTNPDGSDNPAGRSLNRRVCMSVLKSDKNIQISEDIEIPENLKPLEQTFTILLTNKTESPTPAQVELIQGKTDLKVRIREAGTINFFTLGSFLKKANALVVLNKCIDNGFPDALIIGELELEQLIKAEKVIDTREKTIYTIQIVALSKPAENSFFKGLTVKEFKSQDGFYRYIYGQFKGQTEARNQLEKIVEMGFPDAFIVSLDKFK